MSAAAVAAASKNNGCGSHNNSGKPPRRWNEPSTLTATACVFELIETTTSALVVKRKPFVNVRAARHREALRRAKVLTANDPTTLEIKSGDFYEDFAAESRQACLESKQAIRCFEERQARGAEGSLPPERRRKKEPALDAWSPDGARLSEAAASAACQPGGLGAGPRVTLADAYRSFRVLNLAERNITTIDPAFAHFETLTELDLGRNRLRALEHLPEGLVSLSCAANELSGRALDGVTGLPLLSSLDLSYNNLEVDALLNPTAPKRTRNTFLASDGSDGVVASNEDNGNGMPRRVSPPPMISESPPTGRLYFHGKFAALEHLDLSWNCLSDLTRLLRVLAPLQNNLRHLFLAGNPICLLPAYRERVLGGSCGPGLLVLDDLPVSPAERRSAAAAAEASADEGNQESFCHRAIQKGDGALLRGLGPLNMVHFGVKLLGLSRLPDIGTTTAESNRSDDNAGEAAGASGAQGDEGDITAEPPSPKQWGEIEFLIPGDTHNGGNSSSTGPGAFAWAPTVTPPPQGSGSRVDHHQQKLYEKQDVEQPVGATNLGCDDHPPVHEERRGGNNKPWDVAVAVPPSKVMRDTVRFGGLCVLLFVVDEDQPQTAREEDQNTRQEESAVARASTSDGSSPDNGGVLKPGDTSAHPRGDGDHDDNGSGEEPVVQGSSIRPRMRQRRRLVGRGCLSLSPFLDAAWMVREQQGVQQQQQQQKKKKKTSGKDGQDGGEAAASNDDEDEAGAGAGDDVDDPNGGAAAVNVSGQCDLLFEPWVVETLQRGIARRAKEREERKEAARLEAEANAANDPKGKNAKASAAAAAAQQAQEDEDVEEEIGPSASAGAQVEVTLNADAAMRVFAAAGATACAITAAAAAAAAPVSTAEAW